MVWKEDKEHNRYILYKGEFVPEYYYEFLISIDDELMENN